MSESSKMMEKASQADGFIAALDQSGGSTPKALRAYGIPDDAYEANTESMFEMVHKMRSRIITSPSFQGKVRDPNMPNVHPPFTALCFANALSPPSPHSFSVHPGCHSFREYDGPRH